MEKSRIGLIGLGTMGANLARNIADKEFRITVYNRTTEKTDKFIREYGSEFLKGAKTLEAFLNDLEKPRKIMILVKAGNPVQMVIDQLKPLLDKDDIIIDCGNSFYKDTERRFKELKDDGIRFMGCGVSGGKEGALKGPSLMPGGNQKSWEELREILKAIAAEDFEGDPCVTYVGDGGAGHYVKMVHNGIEYGVMQILAEAYEIFRSIYEIPVPEIAKIFEKFNQGRLGSYLMEISVEVLKKKDDKSDDYLINKILDKASQKGTGKWTSIDAMDLGISVPTITAAVFARVESSQKEKREKLAKLYPAKNRKREIPIKELIPILENTLYGSILSTYAQGYNLIDAAAKENNWKIDLAEVSRIWQGGCIIRANILKDLHLAYNNSSKPEQVFESSEFIADIQASVPDMRKLVAYCVKNSLAIPAFSNSLGYFESSTSAKLPANFIQALRDNFGTHTYERTDEDGDFHTEW